MILCLRIHKKTLIRINFIKMNLTKFISNNNNLTLTQNHKKIKLFELFKMKLQIKIQICTIWINQFNLINNMQVEIMIKTHFKAKLKFKSLIKINSRYPNFKNNNFNLNKIYRKMIFH